ncbi:MAG: hypothetical protein QG558_1396 [Campylobacterota bacterium]|nr:hypothetical protein [Campylobacterota bacterium]
MSWLIVKYLLTAGLIVTISEVAKRSDKLGGLITALPLVTFTVLVWMYMEGQPTQKMGSYVVYVFWYSVPTLPMFLTFPLLLKRIGFWSTMGVSALITIACFILTAVILRRFGIELL